MDPQPNLFFLILREMGQDNIRRLGVYMSDSLERDMKHIIIVIIKLDIYSNNSFFAGETKTKANIFQTVLFFCHFRSLSPVGICI